MVGRINLFIKQEFLKEKTFWTQILGKELYQKISFDCEKKFVEVDYLKDQTLAQQFWSFTVQEKERQRTVEGIQETELFGSFFSAAVSGYIAYREMEIKKLSFLQDVFKTVEKILYQSIREIPMRVLIFEMQRQKKEGKLFGKDPEEEYQYYCRRLLKNTTYRKELGEKYPEMVRLLFVKMEFAFQNLRNLLEQFEKEKEKLEKELCGGEKISFIQNLLIGDSDSHQGGKTVIRCWFDNGRMAVYKPHSIRKEKLYQKLYGWFCQKCGMEAFFFFMEGEGDYGWEEYLSVKECQTVEEVKRYFKRMGVHLCLCTLLGGTDMHQGNFLAVGEHPVLFDLETVPGVRKKEKCESADEIIKEMLRDSVSKTGILPFPAWRYKGQGIILSALYRENEVRTTVKLPVVRKPKTSEMYLDYQVREMHPGSSLPIYQGKKADPTDYMGDVQEGFEKAYRIWMEHSREVKELLQPFWNCTSRFLTRHTQQYSMYLSTSINPLFLQSTERRLTFLQIMQKEERSREIVSKEIRDMFQMDIPMLEYKGKEDLPLFGQSPFAYCQNRIGKVGELDLNRQIDLIQISLKMLRECQPETQKWEKSEIKDTDRKFYFSKKWNSLEKAAWEKLGNMLKEHAFLGEEDIGWLTLAYEGPCSWEMKPADLDFYGGIGGIAVFLAQTMRLQRGNSSELYKRAIKKLFDFTDKGENVKQHGTGLMVGTGSLVFSYLLLHYLTGESRFVSYAEKQAAFFEREYEKDEEYDLLSGNAGAIVMLTWLYRLTHNIKWLETAVKIGDFLWEKSEKQERGRGFVSKESECALGGMAHGNSGFIVAYASLLELTGKEKYKERIDSLLCYEDSHYSGEKNNWRDLRFPDQETYANAWCHGAAGILLGRMKLLSVKEYAENERIMEDIKNAAETLFFSSERKELCICHGMAGNYWIMTKYKERFGVNRQQQEAMDEIKGQILKAVLDDKNMLTREKSTMGFMTGISGIAFVLGVEAKKCRRKKRIKMEFQV